jgi:hypothetical protein
MDSRKATGSQRFEPSSRLVHKQVTPLQMPALIDKPVSTSATEEHRSVEGVRSNSTDDKMRALKQYRCARGLCEKCAEKWSYRHHCAPQVQLHAIHECWDLFPDEESSEDFCDSPQQSEDSAQLCLFLSEAAVSGVDSSRSMKMVGLVQGHPVMILIDSGSSHSFLSASVVELMHGAVPLLHPLSVAVSNGEKVLCQQQFLQAAWEIQGCKFTSDLKILPLQHYDLIVGYDWLDKFSPMRVHRGAKWMAIPYGDSTMVLQGILSKLRAGEVIQVYQLQVPGVVKEADISGVPVEIRDLLTEYSVIFASKIEFPPQWDCCHTIPLIPGARPVSI